MLLKGLRNFFTFIKPFNYIYLLFIPQIFKYNISILKLNYNTINENSS